MPTKLIFLIASEVELYYILKLLSLGAGSRKKKTKIGQRIHSISMRY